MTDAITLLADARRTLAEAINDLRLLAVHLPEGRGVLGMACQTEVKLTAVRDGLTELAAMWPGVAAAAAAAAAAGE